MRHSFKTLLVAIAIAATSSIDAYAQDIGLSPTRPTVANGASIQNKGVLQFETGYDAFPQRVPGNQQTVAAGLSYAALDRLRLDFGWSPFVHQSDDVSNTNGIGTITLGGKVELFKEQYHLPKPGLAIQYEAELPTASQHSLQNYGQQITVLINHHYFKDGILDVIANSSLVQADCQTATGCTYGGQQSFALSYHLNEKSRLYAEAYGQNNSASNTPPGTYVFGGFYHQFSDTVGIDGGMRFGVSDHSASVGTTVGLIFGRRVRGKAD
ncbi:hypothetical protein HDF16_000469 [Granulicella aggregans]|uniref:Outer membrane beta-barrel porin/alpha-amylase n=1 Tax=Granulicella aggregans TaxID=474949 RepID=A0A7W7Z9L8_9BACT|nr:hypothetical protein [Granulicella aggregans]MBB5055800.1 hypothetical protein [Granulicella aggregans]